MTAITSKENNLIKEFTKLYNSNSYRREEHMFSIEGVRLVCDIMKNNIPINKLFVTEEGQKRLGENKDKLLSYAKEVYEISEYLAQKISDTVNPQGVFAICEGNLYRDELFTENKGYILLSSIQDPGNMGTILRTAAGLGVKVIVSDDCPDLTSPKVLRSSMGVRYAYKTKDVIKTINELKNKGIKVYASTLSKNSKSISDIDIKGSCICIGNEGNGLKQEVIDACSGSVIIPMYDECESFNAASAATIFMWELSK